MTRESKQLIAQVALRLALFCIWLAFVTFVTTTSCIFYILPLVKKPPFADSKTLQTVGVYGVTAVWVVLQILLAFLLPVWFMRRRAKHQNDAT
jgi:hypothetical protein